MLHAAALLRFDVRLCVSAIPIAAQLLKCSVAIVMVPHQSVRRGHRLSLKSQRCCECDDEESTVACAAPRRETSPHMVGRTTAGRLLRICGAVPLVPPCARNSGPGATHRARRKWCASSSVKRATPKYPANLKALRRTPASRSGLSVLRPVGSRVLDQAVMESARESASHTWVRFDARPSSRRYSRPIQK